MPTPSHLLSTVPGCSIPQEAIGARGQSHLEGEAQRGVDGTHKVQAGTDLCLQLWDNAVSRETGDTEGTQRGHRGDTHLLQCTEDVCIVLLEAPHTCQAGQGAGGLIAMQHPKVSQAQRQLPPRSWPVGEHEAAKRWTDGWTSALLSPPSAPISVLSSPVGRAVHGFE